MRAGSATAQIRGTVTSRPVVASRSSVACTCRETCTSRNPLAAFCIPKAVLPFVPISASVLVPDPRVTSYPLHTRRAAASAFVLPGYAGAELGTPIAGAHISGSRPHGFEHGAKGHRTPHIPSIQRKSASFFSPRRTTPPSSLVSYRGRMGSHRLLRPPADRRLHSLARRSATPARGLFVSVGSGRSMGDTGPNIYAPLKIWISAAGQFFDFRTRRPRRGVLRL